MRMGLSVIDSPGDLENSIGLLKSCTVLVQTMKQK